MIFIRFLSVLFRSFVDFFRDGGMMLAGAISFFTMMAIVPFCLLLVTVFGHFLGQYRDFYQFFLSRLVSFFPKITSEITEELRRIIIYKSLGQFSLVLYCLISFQLFSSFESAINTIFKVRVRRSLIVSIILSLVIVTLVIVILLLSFGATSGISLLRSLRELFPGFHIGRITGFFIRFVIPFLFVFLIMMILYLFLPRKMVKFRHAVSGALFTTILLEAAKHIFTIYAVKVAMFGTIYGPLSAFVIFLLWMYYSACIFLIGAEVVHNLSASGAR